MQQARDVGFDLDDVNAMEQIEEIVAAFRHISLYLTVSHGNSSVTNGVLSELALVPLAAMEKPVFQFLAGERQRFGRRTEHNDELLVRVKKNLAAKIPMILAVSKPPPLNRATARIFN